MSSVGLSAINWFSLSDFNFLFRNVAKSSVLTLDKAFNHLKSINDDAAQPNKLNIKFSSDVLPETLVSIIPFIADSIAVYLPRPFRILEATFNLLIAHIPLATFFT